MSAYLDLIERVDAAVAGESFDDIIPVIVTFLAVASIRSGASKETIMTYLSDSLDAAHGRHNEKH